MAFGESSIKTNSPKPGNQGGSPPLREAGRHHSNGRAVDLSLCVLSSLSPRSSLANDGNYTTLMCRWILSSDVQMARHDCEQETVLQVVILLLRDASLSMQRKGHNGSLLGDVSISHTFLKNF